MRVCLGGSEGERGEDGADEYFSLGSKIEEKRWTLLSERFVVVLCTRGRGGRIDRGVLVTREL